MNLSYLRCAFHSANRKDSDRQFISQHKAIASNQISINSDHIIQSLFMVVESTLNNSDLIFVKSINNPMFLINTS